MKKTSVHAVNTDCCSIDCAIKVLIKSHPELSDQSNREVLRSLLDSHFAQMREHQSLPESNSDINKMRHSAGKMAMLAAAVSGGASAGLLVASVIPAIPVLSIISAIIGLCGGGLVASKVNHLSLNSK